MSMTNEELAELISSGHTEYCAELWENIKRLLYSKAVKFYYSNQALCIRSGVELDDIKQVCYFAMLNAVGAYQPEKGFAFTTYINYHFQNAARGLLGIRNKKQDILSSCGSLDMPIGEDEDTTLLELIGDSSDDYEASDKAHTLETLRGLLDETLEALPPVYADVLKLKYFGGLSYAEIAERLKLGTHQNARNIEKAALVRIRASSYRKRLQDYLTVDISG